MENGQRILIIGSPGAGKSTFAKSLAQIIDIPVYHLDKIYWLPNFVRPEETDFNQKLKKIIALDHWIIDGNYYRTLEQRLKRTTLIYFLDYSKYLCVKSVLRRMKQYQTNQRDDIATGCIETYDRDFLKWVWDFPTKYRPIIIKILKKYPNIKMITFKSRDEATKYLEILKQEKQK